MYAISYQIQYLGNKHDSANRSGGNCSQQHRCGSEIFRLANQRVLVGSYAVGKRLDGGIQCLGSDNSAIAKLQHPSRKTKRKRKKHSCLQIFHRQPYLLFLLIICRFCGHYFE